ncbi:MAG: hypothetical protein E7105_08540 [Prevotella sp.]|nr:hypothetical protein [Prevotella sp.]
MKLFRYFLLAGMMLLPQMNVAQRMQQTLGRGVVAVANGSNVTVTWRRLAQEPENAQYKVYVNGSLATTTSRTYWKTTTGMIPTGAKVTVSLVTPEGVEQPQSIPFTRKSFDMRNIFVDINFEKGGSPLASADFNTAYVWPIDLDGDGEMDYVVNRKSNTNALDCYVEGYLRTGEHLWTVKLGPNELSCAGQDDQITVADMDCDGLGDVIIQASDGTQFWDADEKTFGLFVKGKTTGDSDGDGIIDYETQSTRNAPRYISVIDGMKGCEKASIEQSYNQHYNRTNRASLMGDEYNKHVGHMGVFYHDGIHPAVVMEWHMRGTGGDHHYYNIGVAYDFSSGKAGALKELFNTPTSAPAFHQIRVGDMDGDGRDEMIVGGYTMDHDGSILFNTGISHGDRFRTSDIDPERPGLETFAIQQYAPDMLGQVLYDARTGEFIKKWYLSAVGDIGRGECMDIDKNHLGWEMWSTMDGKVYDAQGNLITEYENQYPCEGIWWDNELDREVVQTSDSHYNVYIQDFFKGREVEFAKLSNYRYTTVYAKRAAFWGDIIGDWREELILLHKESGVIVGITGVTTDYASDADFIYCLQQDPHYSGDCTTKGYYQSPNPGFYLGYDMPRPQLPPCMVTDLVAKADGQFVTFDRSATAAYASGKSVLFDLTYPAQTFTLNSAFSPSVIYAMPVRNQSITLGGTGSVEGNLQFWKGQQGRFIVNTPLNHTGGTFISEGILEVNTTVQGDIDLRARGTLAGNAVVTGKLNLEGALNYEGCRLMPGAAAGDLGVITLKQGLTIDKRMFVEADIKDADAAADLVRVEGDLTLGANGQLVFTVVPDVAKPQPARFKLLEYTGQFTGKLTQVAVRGLQGLSYNIVDENHALWLVIHEQRQAAQGVRWTGAESTLWDYQTANFTLNDEATEFVAGDAIVFDDDVVKTTIQTNELMPVSSVTFENNTKSLTLSGTGGITGTGDLVMNGQGRVTLNAINSNYTGKTIINSGTVTVAELADGGLPSSIGAAGTVATNWQIGKATLIVSNTNTATNRGLTINDEATIQINSGVTSLKGIIQGNGRLVKKGSGQLNITYAGNNTWKSTELNAGTLAMGVWNTTFGTASSTIDVTGNAAITIFDSNSTSTTPTLANTITVAKGKTLTVNAGQRCNVRGKWTGEGTIKISFPYVRGDFSTNMADFEGVLNPTSGQFRLVSAMNLQKGTFTLGAGVYAVGVKAGMGTENSYTHSIGALSSTATDAQLSTSVWNVGYLGTNTTFAGIIGSGATLNKYGDGTLTLTGASAGPINIYAGEVKAMNTSKSTTTGTITVRSGGLLTGTGQVQNVVVQSNGTLGAGQSATAVGTLTVNGTLTLNSGAVLRLRTRSTATRTTCDAFKVAGTVKLTSPVINVTELNTSYEMVDDAELQVFTGAGAVTVSGTVTMQPATPKAGYLWDTSALTTEGIIRVVADPVGITSPAAAPSQTGAVYDLAGRKIAEDKSSARQATKGIYVINGVKVLKK